MDDARYGSSWLFRRAPPTTRSSRVPDAPRRPGRVPRRLAARRRAQEERAARRETRAVTFYALLLLVPARPGRSRGGVFRDVTKSSGIAIARRRRPDAVEAHPDDDRRLRGRRLRRRRPPRPLCDELDPALGQAERRRLRPPLPKPRGRPFEDVTEKAGIHACGLGMGAFWVDLDGDGRLDLYLTNVGPNAVWWNRGDGTFERGVDTGLEDPLFSVGAGFLDYDGDGKVDVVVANYLDSTPEWEAAQPQFQLRVPEDYVGQPSHLYRNLGGRKFEDVTKAAGLAVPPADDEDARRRGARLRRRRARRPLLRQRPRHATASSATAATAHSRRSPRRPAPGSSETTPAAGMGVAVGDPFGDGRDHVFVTNFGDEPNSLYRNVDGVLFEDAGEASGAGAASDRPSVRWGTHFADFDNDGWPDLYAVGGHLAPEAPATVRALQDRRGRLRRGRGPVLRPERRAASQRRRRPVRRVDGFGRFRAGTHGRARDRRGRPRGPRRARPRRRRHRRSGAGSSATRSATAGAGSRSTSPRGRIGGPSSGLASGSPAPAGRTQTQTWRVSTSYASGSLVPLHFGLGEETAAAAIEVRWPDGRTQTFRNVAARATYRLRPGGELEPVAAR